MYFESLFFLSRGGGDGELLLDRFRLLGSPISLISGAWRTSRLPLAEEAWAGERFRLRVGLLDVDRDRLRRRRSPDRLRPPERCPLFPLSFELVDI